MLSRKIDVAVIGSGPAGLAAAIKAKEAGVERVVIIERGEYPGGLLDQCIHNGFGLSYFGEDLTGPEYAHRFIEKANDLGVEILLQSMVIKLFPDRNLLISSEKGLTYASARAIVLAMGCRERTRESLEISGTRVAGIMTAGTAQRYVNVYGYIPGKEVVILGSGDIGMIIARRLALEGAVVKAVVEALPYVGGLVRNEVQCLRDFDIPMLLGHTVKEIHGRDRVEAVTIAQVDKNWHPIAGTEKIIACDTLLISAGLIPENELSRMAGIILDPVTGGPVVDCTMQTSVSGIFAGGNVLHVNDLVDNVTREAELAGAAAADFSLGRTRSKTSVIRMKAGDNIRYIVPQNVTAGEKVNLFLRVKEPAEKVRIRVGHLLAKSFRLVRPGEMVGITVSSTDWRKMRAETNELVVSCENKGD
jgi:NADPH-dependent 2,4-dienoyl-CoA reductase/sulfur reductase-like enzyme